MSPSTSLGWGVGGRAGVKFQVFMLGCVQIPGITIPSPIAGESSTKPYLTASSKFGLMGGGSSFFWALSKLGIGNTSYWAHICQQCWGCRGEGYPRGAGGRVPKSAKNIFLLKYWDPLPLHITTSRDKLGGHNGPPPFLFVCKIPPSFEG